MDHLIKNLYDFINCVKPNTTTHVFNLLKSRTTCSRLFSLPLLLHYVYGSTIPSLQQSLEEEAEDFEEEIESLQGRAEVVLQYLHTVSAVAYTSAKEKLERVLRRHPE